MGNQQANKGSTSQVGGAPPSWATPGTDQYANNNTMLQSAPIAVANQSFQNGGTGPVSQYAQGQLASRNGTNSWMDQAAQAAQNPGAIDTSALRGDMGNAQNGFGQVGEQNYQGVYGRAGQGGAAEQYLTGTAAGDYLNGSPYLNNIIDTTNRKINDSTNAMFAGSGRYGSGANQGVLADSIGANTSNLLNSNYQSERDRQMQAASQLESAQQGRLGLQNSAASGVAGVQGANVNNRLQANQQAGQLGQAIAGLEGQNIGNRMTGANLLGQLGQQAFGNRTTGLTSAAGLEQQGLTNQLGMISALPTIQNNKVFDANQQMQVGGQIDQAAQNQLNDLISQWQKGDQEDWSRLGGLISGGTGAAGNYGSQTGTSQTSSPSNPLQAIGLLGSLAMAPVTGGGSLLGNFLSR